MKWTLEDNCNARAGFLRIMCDGERAADVFPFIPHGDPKEIRARAIYMVAALNMANEDSVRVAIAS